MTQDPEKNDIAVCVEAQPVTARSEYELARLPEKEYISTDDDKFYDEAVKLLPADIQNEVKAHARSQSIKYSRWEILLCFAVTAMLCFIAYCFVFPETKPVEISRFVPITEVREKQDDVLHGKMKHLFEDKMFQSCIDCLPEEKLREIIANKKKLKQNTYALALYLNSIFMVNCVPETKNALVEHARKVCDELVRNDPDYPDWHVHKLRFDNYSIVSGDGSSTLRTINTKNKNSEERDRLRRQVEYMEKIRSEAFSGKLQEVFDQTRCKIYIAYWLRCLAFKNYHDKTPDNSNGLEERLRAYEICRKYENNLEFLTLREFIIKTIKARKYFTDYFFDNVGDMWRDTVLNTELARIKKIKEKLTASEK